MVQGADIAIALISTIKMITEQLDLPKTHTVLCTDSRSLYECLVKLDTTKEKRLMIDVMALRESYERRELTEIRWINGEDNPADAMTKANPTKALATLIDSNRLRVRKQGWVNRGKDTTEAMDIGKAMSNNKEKELPVLGVLPGRSGLPGFPGLPGFLGFPR